jgi:hypothetical protein
MDQSPTDVVIGFGTNSAFDIAVRKDAKALIFADWHPEPLQCIANLITPLALVARSPSEFFSFLAMVPIAESQANEPLASLLPLLNQSYNHYRFSGRNGAEGPRFNLFSRLVDRLAQDPRISDEQIAFVGLYFNSLLFGSPSPFSAKLDIFINYFLRYSFPASSSQGVDLPFGSERFETAFSSLEAFRRLQSLLLRAHYLQMPILDDDGYAAAKRFAEARGLASFTLSISNIFDVNYNLRAFGDGALTAFLRRRVAELGSPARPLVVFRTSQIALPHDYFRYSLESPGDVASEMAGKGSLPDELAHHSWLRHGQPIPVY